jgi:ParB/RepB/Spo0J family partition protein
MKDYYTDILVKDIVSESDRKNGGMGNIDILAQNIEQNGLINPPTVVEIGNGKYKVIAGRRRIEAVRQLKWQEVQVKISEEKDEDHLEAIALSENVNRMEMNPLDEAEYFKKLLDAGTDIKDIAATYDRSISGIRHRVRLCDLHEQVKEMFREGKIKLSGAALLAGLPAKDQARFAKKYGERSSIGSWEISSFIHQAQHSVITLIADTQCEKCKNRTYNTEPGLFEDFGSLEDVCFDQDCYTGKWKKLIENLIAKQEDVPQTERNIILDRDIPNFLPKKTETIHLGEVEYKLLAHQNHTWSKASEKEKKDIAWLVTGSSVSPDDSMNVTIQRVKYKIFERPVYNSTPSDPVKEFLIEHSDVAIEEQKATAKKLKAKYEYPWNFINKVESAVFDTIISERLKKETRGNLTAAYLEDIYLDENQEFTQNFDQKIFTAIFGPEGITRISDIPDEPLVRKLFLFLTATNFDTRDVPDINDDEDQWAETEKSLFLKFAQVTREEYIGMYREILSREIRAAVQEGTERKDEEDKKDE